MPSTSTSYVDGMPRWCSTPSAVDALPWGSRSITSTRWPSWASAAPMFTVVVVLPTPPFWLATTITRVAGGRGKRRCRAARRARKLCSAARASGRRCRRRTRRCRCSASSPARPDGEARRRVGVVFHVKPSREFRVRPLLVMPPVDENGGSCGQARSAARARTGGKHRPAVTVTPASPLGPAVDARRRRSGASGQPTRPGSAPRPPGRRGSGTAADPSPSRARAPPARAQPEPRQDRRPRPPRSPRSRADALHRQQRPVGRPPAASTSRAAVQGRDRPRGDHVERSLAVQLLGPAPHAPRPSLEPRSATTSSRKWCAAAAARPASPRGPDGRSPAPAPAARRPMPMSQTARALGDQLGEDRAVEQVPLPQPGHLARTDQPAHRPGVGQPVGVRARPAAAARTRNTPRAASGAGGAVSRETIGHRVASGRAGSRRTGGARRPRTPRPGRPRPPRRGRPCARTRSSARGTPAPRTP